MNKKEILGLCEFLKLHGYENTDNISKFIFGLQQENKQLKIQISAREEELVEEMERLNNIINRTTKYVQSLSSKGRGCDIYEDIKQEILKELKGSDSNVKD